MTKAARLAAILVGGFMRSKIWLAAVAAAFFVMGPVAAAENEAPKPYEDVVSPLKRQDGLLPVFVDRARGHIYIQLPPPDADGISGRFLYLTALKTGLGSAPVGLDRARVGETRILVFRRLGSKVVAEYENPRFRAVGAPDAEQKAARDSFATSTVWAGDVAAVTPDGGTLVDISKFLTRDVFDAPDALKDAGEKGYKLAADLSFADAAATKVFPENLEFEGRVTFTSDTPGDEVSNIVPDPKLFTLVVRHSLVKLPEPGFKPRLWDPRAGGFSTEVVDYAAPLGQDVVYRLANHFRLEKVDPTAARSRVKKPIVFYIDRAAPEPIRTALVEGVNWWAKAFDAAGYIDAFRAEVMPEGMDPLDVRYNVVNWIDRATRGWSYGQSIVDPRTGEIIKGSVLLGSLRVRQDMLIFEGLAGAKEVGTGGPNDPVRVSLARIRQLGAHEVGHALGFAHNFAGSTQDRASVMDYPPPRIKLTNGRIDLSDAYGVGVGKWDDFTVDWLYGDVPDGDAGRQALDAKVRKMLASGMRYVTDADSRPLGAAQPWGNLVGRWRRSHGRAHASDAGAPRGDREFRPRCAEAGRSDGAAPPQICADLSAPSLSDRRGGEARGGRGLSLFRRRRCPARSRAGRGCRAARRLACAACDACACGARHARAFDPASLRWPVQ